MTLSDEELRTIWQRGSRAVTSDRSACLTEAEWARLLSKEADDGERTRAAEHIGSCTECAGEYRLLLPLQPWVAEVEQVLPRDDAAQRAGSTRWRGWLSWLRPALVPAAAAVLLVTQAVALYLLVGTRRQNAQLEAQLAQDKNALLSAVAAAMQEELRRQPPVQTAERVNVAQRFPAPLSTPQLGVAVVDLDPRDAGGVRGSADPQPVTTGPDASLVTLILNFAPLAARSTLEVEVGDQGGQSLWKGRIERDRSTASLTLALPTQGYPAGRYGIRIFDVTRVRTPIATYAVIIQAPPAKSR